MVASKVFWEKKLNAKISSEMPFRDGQAYEQAVVASALWAAAGDALGWMTELSRGEAGVAYRTGSKRVSHPVHWQRVIGGRGGPRVDLPAGTYSDDTQLRLAVSRAIRGDGEFDAEAFAKIEITVWPSYALGAGLGTKAAAANLTRRSVNWFSNFFDTNGHKYTSGGGNGAAMRIQPHVWAASSSSDAMLLNVLKDALVTHGHPHGFCGAVFHALCVAYALEHREVPSPSHWVTFVERLGQVPDLIGMDPQLAAFWQSAWENDVGQSLQSAVKIMQHDASRDLEVIGKDFHDDTVRAYRLALEKIGCLTEKFRGSGFKTALAAALLSWLHRARPIEDALVLAANELDSDTDTIATMAGAILGCVVAREPSWEIQDRAYIVREAKRLAAIAAGRSQDSFAYPDLGHWSPPTRQTDSVGKYSAGFALAGLGLLEAVGQEYSAGDAVWQWFALPFGQTILAKRRFTVRDHVTASQLPGERQAPVAQRQPNQVRENQNSLPFRESRPYDVPEMDRPEDRARSPGGGIDYWTEVVIRHDFDDFTLGKVMNRLLEETQSIDSAIAFAAIIAKAKLARGRRRRG